MKLRTLNRRNFLRTTSAGIGGIALTPSLLAAGRNWKGANDRILLGHIGLGSRGTNELMNYLLPLDGFRSVAFCDVYRDRREKAAELARELYSKSGKAAPESRAYLDFEELLDRKDIDAVHITTPDHWHVPAAIRAARSGKHIMLAKPLGLSYPHYMILKEALKTSGVSFHYATQQRTMRHMQVGIDMIRDGKIGEIERVDVWCPGKNPVDSPVCREVPVPEGFDFDRWTGPAPLNSYCPDRVTNNSSWFQYDYSIGFLGGWGAHPLDVMVWGIRDQVDGVYACEGEGTFWSGEGIYDNIYSWDVSYQYENGLLVHFMSIDRATEHMLKHRKMKEENGTTFYGSKGWISLSRSSAQSDLPELDRKLNDFPKNAGGWILSEENTMGKVWLEVIHRRIPECCPLDEAIISDTLSHMGDIAIRASHKVTWDPVAGRVIDDQQANNLYIREMRQPYGVS
jgi:predicted dehydrogenase